jgi:hypothetical protein
MFFKGDNAHVPPSFSHCINCLTSPKGRRVSTLLHDRRRRHGGSGRRDGDKKLAGKRKRDA